MKRFGHLTSFVMLLLLACASFLSSKAGALVLIAYLERATSPMFAPAGEAAQAIVVLTGGDLRMLKVADLHRKTGLPVLASGGDGEAAAIKQHLQNDFQVQVKWTEEKSLNTEENAVFSAEILARENIRSIILVTHALHMQRARRMFLDRGLDVIAASTDFSPPAPLQWGDFLPSTEGRKLTGSALHEIFGLTWYRLRRSIR